MRMIVIRSNLLLKADFFGGAGEKALERCSHNDSRDTFFLLYILI
jgi:hypothetical protein